MSDYIIKMDLDKINPNPINEQIYGYNPVEHKELKKSIELNGLLEPLTITRDNLLVSGHRRYKVIREIGWEDVDCRLREFDNVSIALVELNKSRIKTKTELLNEAEILQTEYSKMIKKGRPKNGEKREGKNWSILNVSEKLNIGATNLKKLMSVKKYDESLLEKIDLGLLSIGKAYSIVRDKYILNEKGAGRKPNDFRTEYRVLLDKYNPTIEELEEEINLYYKGNQPISF
jgi:ParB-like chromosome segregation protein Spo0J